MTIGRQIADAHSPLEPGQAARIIVTALFDVGPNKLSPANRYVAIQTVMGGLIEWRKQLLAGSGADSERWKKLYKDTKAQLDDVMLKYTILKKES